MSKRQAKKIEVITKLVEQSHTIDAYSALNGAYVYFNQKLFGGQLPSCVITLQRKSKMRGYFASERFGVKDGEAITDEIALNPAIISERTVEETLSTLVHEMVHLWQFKFGKPPRKAYHNREWADKMKEVGLQPSSTGQPGGKEVGQNMTHYIVLWGPYQKAFQAMPPVKLYADRWQEEKKKPKESKMKFTCDGCGANAWGKPDLHILCGDCEGDDGDKLQMLPAGA